MISPRSIRLLCVALVLLFTVGCDQTTKHFARIHLGTVTSSILPGRFVEFTLAENSGGFLSLGASLPAIARGGLLTVGVGIGLAFLLAYLVRRSHLDPVSFFGWLLVCAGGISNLVDRCTRHGLVTDFIVVRVGPFHTGVFNLADMAIVAGMLIVAISFRRHANTAAPQQPGQPG